jgi:hypothetical protein
MRGMLSPLTPIFICPVSGISKYFLCGFFLDVLYHVSQDRILDTVGVNFFYCFRHGLYGLHRFSPPFIFGIWKYTIYLCILLLALADLLWERAVHLIEQCFLHMLKYSVITLTEKIGSHDLAVFYQRMMGAARIA